MKSRVIIFSLVYYPDFVGGAEVAVKEITDRLGEEIDFHMVTLRTNRARREKIGSVTVHRVGPYVLGIPLIGKYLFHGLKYLFPWLACLRASKLQKSQSFSVIWSIMANYAGFAARLFKLRFPEVNFLLTLQEGDPIPYIKRRVRSIPGMYKSWQDIFLQADKVQAISNYLAEFAKEMNPGIEAVVVPNAVDTSIFNRPADAEDRLKVRRELGIPESANTLVTASRLVVKNGIGDVITAMIELPDTHFIVLGSGSLESVLKKQAREQGVIDRIHFLGYLPHVDIVRYLQAADIFIRPSLSEGLGNSFLEAMSAGLPVIATPVGGIPDFLQDGNTGIFCQVQNPDSIVIAVERLGGDRDLRRRIIDNGKSMVSEVYTWDRVISDMKILFLSDE